MRTASRVKAVLSGMIAADPHQGGATWAVLQYALGLRRLGHQVTLIEPLPRASMRPGDGGLERSSNAAYFREVVAAFGLDRDSALLLEGTRETVGLPYDRLRHAAREADLLLNISGMLTDPELTEPVPVRAYLDLDPAFVQLWHATQGVDMRFGCHTHFVTVGLNVGRPGCRVPTCGRAWLTTRPPVFLDHWRVAEAIRLDALTTVANWRGYGSFEHEGVHYGQKAHSFRRLIELPRRTPERLSPAINIHLGDARDVAALADNGWEVLDPTRVAGTPGAYQAFVQDSKGELGVAKSGYVASRCGWFSDRSAAYLASGRPVLAQGTGFEDHLPTGEGLFVFHNQDDVLTAIEGLNRDYPRHAARAREVAVSLFDSDAVLGSLLERLSTPPGVAS
jgi:hypothetical protein